MCVLFFCHDTTFIPLVQVVIAVEYDLDQELQTGGTSR